MVTPFILLYCERAESSKMRWFSIEGKASRLNQTQRQRITSCFQPPIEVENAQSQSWSGGGRKGGGLVRWREEAGGGGAGQVEAGREEGGGVVRWRVEGRGRGAGEGGAGQEEGL